MRTVILKFGGSSVADNIKLNVVAEKVIKIKEEAQNVIVVVSAQGKTTDRLIREAQDLSAIPNEREMDMLLSTGEQITASKLSILLNRMGHKAISLTGWQAGIITNNIHKTAKIEQICTARIEKELEKGNIVIVSGFQGIDENNDITTLGRGGSDTTAVALQAALNADKCYIFSDVDGIYSADPNMITMAKKLDEISFDEMQEIADSGAKVLHNRCVQIGKRFSGNIVAKSTFDNGKGTKICKEIETTEVKSIVKNEKLILIKMKAKVQKSKIEMLKFYQDLLQNNIIIENFKNKENSEIQFRIEKTEQNKILELIETKYIDFELTQEKIVKLSIIGYGIIQDNTVLNKITNKFEKYDTEILEINLNQSKIEIIAKEIKNEILQELHTELIK